MKVEEALRAMTTIDGLYDGTPERGAFVVDMHRKLIQNPSGFWDALFERLCCDSPSPERQTAERLLRSGAVTETTTFGEIAAILAAEAREQKGKQ